MRIDILTLFPDTVNAVLHESIIGRAVKKGILEINCTQIRDFTDNRQNQVDDYPYGGGWGCVMMAQPLKSCLDSVLSDRKNADGVNMYSRERTRVIYMSPQGKTFDQTCARRLRDDYDRIVLVCGHYEGVDERFIEECVDEEISIGDFVMTGGEIAAMAVADSVCRLVPGVLSDEECYTGESHWDGLLEYPQYTRPEVWEGRQVPDVLLNGDHAKIEKWRRKQQILRTMEKRPDMFEKLDFADIKDRELLDEIKKDSTRLKLTEPLSCRRASRDDMGAIMSIVSDARAVLKKRRVDQWQGEYPEPKDFEPDIDAGECYVIQHGGEIAGFFCLCRAHQENYERITDGKWTADMDYCVAHRAAVSAKYRGTGITAFMFDSIDEVCRSYGLRCIRADTHRKNRSMQRLLRESGYRYRGNVVVDSEPGHDPYRQAFEKILKQKNG